MRLPHAAALILCLLALLGCSSRNWYEGLRHSEQMRQVRSQGEPARTAPDVGYDTYQDERRRIEQDAAR